MLFFPLPQAFFLLTLLSLIVCSLCLFVFMGHISSGSSSKTKSYHKSQLLGELVEVKKQIIHKDEKLRQLTQRLQRLEQAQARQSQQDEEKWSLHNFAKRHHQHQPQQQHSFNFVKLPSFHGSNDPSLYLDWEAKVEHFFHVYKVTKDQKVRLASLAFDGYPLGEDFINEGRGFSPTHLKFFLLVFSQIKRSQREDQA